MTDVKDSDELKNNDKIKNARIIFVDFKGVGKSFGSQEGLSLVKALKKRYRKKKTIILFSAHTRFSLTPDFQIADDTIPKNSDIDTFIALIDKYK